MAFTDDVNYYLGIASQNTGVSQNTLSTLLTVENSSGNYNAVSSTGASGLFQFTNGTWQQYGGGQNIFDPQASANAAGSYWNAISSSLSSSLGQTPQDWQTYLGYQQGPGTAAILLNADPNAPISQYLPATSVSANGGDPTGTVGQFLNHVQQQWVNAGGSSTGVTGSNGVTTGTSGSNSGGILGSFFGSFQSAFVRFTVAIVGIIFIYAGLRLFGNRGSFSVDPAAFRAGRAGTQGSRSAGGALVTQTAPSKTELTRRAKEASDRAYNLGISKGRAQKQLSDIYRMTRTTQVGAKASKPKSEAKPKGTTGRRSKQTVAEQRATLHESFGARSPTKYGPKDEE